ncbi:MAG: hypothetical protein NPIRA02_29970 [Nitrospirales bacterium]|nr:MAG: hypothetical protein NPIRA02_29970 [Nitrospirales bacterium]
MQYFSARDTRPSEYCKERVRECEVYVGLIGFRYGSLVRDRPELSYTKLEFEAASEVPAITRLVFILNDDASVPQDTFNDLMSGNRQKAFREKLKDCGIMCSLFRDIHELELGIYQALTELPESEISNENSIEGLPVELLTALIKDCPDGLCSKRYKLPELLEMFPSHSKEVIQDASYDLKRLGLLEVQEAFYVWEIRLLPEAYEQVDPQIMGWDPKEDAVVLAKLMIDTNEGSASSLQEQLRWERRRFNPAQRIIVDEVPYGCVSRHCQPDYVASWVALTPEFLAALKRLVQGR